MASKNPTPTILSKINKIVTTLRAQGVDARREGDAILVGDLRFELSDTRITVGDAVMYCGGHKTVEQNAANSILGHIHCSGDDFRY